MNTPNYPQPREEILQIKPYIGGEAKAPTDRLYRLASNENPLGPSPKAMEAYRAASGSLHRYPDGTAMLLREAIAARYGLPVDGIVCGAGSNEILSLLLRAYAGPGDEVIYSRYGFLMYPIMIRIAGATAVIAHETAMRTDVAAVLAAVTERTRVVIISNPNNPTGSYLTAEELRAPARRVAATRAAGGGCRLCRIRERDRLQRRPRACP